MDAKIRRFSAYPPSWKGKHAHRYDEDGFRCKVCQAYVHNLPAYSGVQNRNHCPFCLHSRHLDLERAGDRLSACKATMQPIGLTLKHTRNKYGYAQSGELQLIHRCSDCGHISINRIAADDAPDGLISLLCAFSNLDSPTLQQLVAGGIQPLKCGDAVLVERQLFGNIYT